MSKYISAKTLKFFQKYFITFKGTLQNSRVHFALKALNPSQIKTSKFWARYHKLTLAKSCSTKSSGVHGAASLSRIQIGRLLQEEKILFCILKRRLHTSNHLPLTTGKHHKKVLNFRSLSFDLKARQEIQQIKSIHLGYDQRVMISNLDYRASRYQSRLKENQL